jgi:hypothetical protein
MNRFFPLRSWLVAALFLGGCSSQVATPWDRPALDPGQVATREPLEIPPDFNTLPEPGPKKNKGMTTLPKWVDPGEEQGGGSVPSLFKVPASSEEGESLSRNEREELPSWMGSETKSE